MVMFPFSNKGNTPNVIKQTHEPTCLGTPKLLNYGSSRLSVPQTHIVHLWQVSFWIKVAMEMISYWYVHGDNQRERGTEILPKS